MVDPVHNVLSASQTSRCMATSQLKLKYSYCMRTHALWSTIALRLLSSFDSSYWIETVTAKVFNVLAWQS